MEFTFVEGNDPLILTDTNSMSPIGDRYGSESEKNGSWVTRNSDSLKTGFDLLGGLVGGFFGKSTSQPQAQVSSPQPKTEDNSNKLMIGIGIGFLVLILIIFAISKFSKKDK